MTAIYLYLCTVICYNIYIKKLPEMQNRENIHTYCTRKGKHIYAIHTEPQALKVDK